MSDLRNKLTKHAVGEHIRVIIDKDHILAKSVREVAKEFSHVVMKVETTKEKTKEDIKLLEHVEIESFNITPDNIEELILKELEELNLTEEELYIAKDELRISLAT